MSDDKNIEKPKVSARRSALKAGLKLGGLAAAGTAGSGAIIKSAVAAEQSLSLIHI